jgi:hypothetical protein
LLLGTGKEWEFRWQDREADIRDMREIGPFGSPDDFREALGLARIAQFKLPGGDVVTAELPGSFLKPIEPKREELVRVAKEVEEGSAVHEIGVVRAEVEAAIERMEELPSEELLAEPPSVEPSEPVVVKAKPVGAALRGGKRKK